jgi:ubiquinone/menaquinone biosynthesis C-methylase UbiE
LTPHFSLAIVTLNDNPARDNKMSNFFCKRIEVQPLDNHLPLLAAVLATFLFFTVNVGAQGASSPASKTFKGRVIAPPMSYRGADWLDRPDRERTQQPEKVLDTLKIAPGSTVADIGAGTGYFSLRLAKRVGPQGRVLATDIQPQMLAFLKDNMRAHGIQNIELILCTPTDAKLPEGQLNLALMVDVYHELEYPEETIAQVRRALKPDGRLVLIEYRGEDPTVPIKPEHKTTLSQVRTEVEPMGFRLQEVLEFLPQQRIMIFVRNDEPGFD